MQTLESSELVEVVGTISLMYIFLVEEMQERPACIHTIFLIGVLCNVRTGELENICSVIVKTNFETRSRVQPMIGV